MKREPTGLVTSFLFAAAMLLSAFAAHPAEEAAQPKPALEPGTPFVDGAILQREMAVPVWGWSQPGTKITVEFAGQKKSATCDKIGKWINQSDR